MLKKELNELLKNMKDDDNIDETLKGTDTVKALVNGGLTLDAFKAKMNDPAFKSFMDSEKDKHSTKYLETWKANNLDDLVQAEYVKKHPEDKDKNPELTAALKKQAELEKKLQEETNARLLETAKTSITKKLTEKKLPIELADRIADLDEAKSNENFTFFEKLFKDHDKELKKGFVDHNMYIPGGEGGKGDGSDSSIEFAKKLAAGVQPNANLQKAKEDYFK